MTEKLEQSEVVLNKASNNKVGTFAGEEASVPNYVLNLLRKISAIKVLYLKEYRKPIGRDEAQQLLSLKVQRGGTDVLQRIQETVDNLLGVEIDAFQGSSTQTEAELDVDNLPIDDRQRGWQQKRSGQVRLIAPTKIHWSLMALAM